MNYFRKIVYAAAAVTMLFASGCSHHAGYGGYYHHANGFHSYR